MNCAVYYLNNSLLIELDGLQNAADDSYVNTATVAASLKDANGDNLVGESWPVSLAYVGGSNGKYQGTVAAGLTVAKGDIIKLFVTATAAGLAGEWTEDLQVEARYG